MVYRQHGGGDDVVNAGFLRRGGADRIERGEHMFLNAGEMGTVMPAEMARCRGRESEAPGAQHHAADQRTAEQEGTRADR